MKKNLKKAVADANNRDADLMNFQAEDFTLLVEKAIDKSKCWKVLIVDDDESVHAVTKLVLKKFVFDERPLKFLCAYNTKEAMRLITENPDTALIFLDVVMERDTSGFEVIKYIRETLKNKLVRIVIRTGQPGQAPERKVVFDFDINDYRLKTELTEDKLFVTTLTALRSFKDILTLAQSRKGLEKIIESSSAIFKIKSFKEFVLGVLTQITSMITHRKTGITRRPSGVIAINRDGKFLVEAAVGKYEDDINRSVEEVLDEDVYPIVEKSIQEKSKIFSPERFSLYFESKSGSKNLIYFEDIKKLNEWDRDLIDIFCTNISIGFDNIHLNNEIENTQKEVIFTLGEIAEARSRETGNHVKRVAEYSKILALKVGFTEREAELIRMASPLHDIGKVAIPDSILNKPGKLTEEEFEIMKAHAQIGYDMLKNSKRHLIQVGAIIALQHHEKYNGTGYPNRLKGEDIHIYGRITAVADVFDALGSERVYKKAWELDRILELFHKERGEHFDPVLIDIFFENLDEILKVRDSFPDSGGDR